MGRSKYFLLLVAMLPLLPAASCGGEDGAAGAPGEPGSGLTGPYRELSASLAISQPANGTHFVMGEQAVVTVIVKDQYDKAFSLSDLSQLSLYVYGPQETTKTMTAVNLLNASTDRSQRPHHYIDLLTNPEAQFASGVVTYALRPVSDEEPGTYIVTMRAVLKDAPLEQAMPCVEFQLGTAIAETQIIDKEKCAKCHKGAASGQFYFHHVDPRQVGQSGSPSIDSLPVMTCKSCHNTEGYAAYRDPANPDNRIPDPIVKRVHGVHMGKHLESAANQTVFADYLDVEFPANVKNCTACHSDDRWKTKPSQLACGACHDNIWFGDPAAMPETAEAHPGGQQADDSLCASCHPADIGGSKPVAVAHQIEPPAFQNTVELSMTPPANGEYYVAGETPQVTITIRDAASGATINPAAIVEPADSQAVQSFEWRRANLFVSGPRKRTMPVLTTEAINPDPTHSYANNDFRVRIDPANEDLRVTRSSTAITYQLADVADLEPGTYTAFVEIMPAAPLGGWGLINFQVKTATEEPMVATNCIDCHDDARMHGSYFAVQFKPDICKNCHDYERQMPDRITWTDRNAGYGAAPLARRVHGVHFGHYLDKPEEVHATYDFSGVIFPQDVRNCVKCHSETDAWKTEPSRVACLACHDKDAAITHATVNTLDATPADPWNGDEVESCKVCHGAGREFAPDKVHNIWDPYKPPYPREPAE
ncbi:MAG: hypothetical protein HY716_08435 [Planctomycetes bacterium]|nr:hypothetical protein [Planctomycetota bacterium]